MRLLTDEDTAVQIMEPLRHVLLGHEVAHVSELSWKGKKDLRVLPDAKNAGFHALTHGAVRRDGWVAAIDSRTWLVHRRKLGAAYREGGSRGRARAPRRPSTVCPATPTTARPTDPIPFVVAGHRSCCIRSVTERSLSLNRSTRRLQRASVADTK